MEKGLEMKKLVLSGFLASEEIYLNQLEALLLVRHINIHTYNHKNNLTFYKTFFLPAKCCCCVNCVSKLSVVDGHTESRTTVAAVS